MGICKNQEMHNAFLKIVNDTTFKTSKYGFTPSRLERNINSNYIQIDTAMNLLLCFNQYYSKKYELKDVFNIDLIKDYYVGREKIIFKAGSTSSKERGFIFFIKMIFDGLYEIFKYPMKLLGYEFDSPSDERAKFILNLILIIVSFILLYLFISNIVKHDSNDSKEGSIIHKSINSGASR